VHGRAQILRAKGSIEITQPTFKRRENGAGVDFVKYFVAQVFEADGFEQVAGGLRCKAAAGVGVYQHVLACEHEEGGHGPVGGLRHYLGAALGDVLA
jgi:hypothetical protein